MPSTEKPKNDLEGFDDTLHSRPVLSCGACVPKANTLFVHSHERNDIRPAEVSYPDYFTSGHAENVALAGP